MNVKIFSPQIYQLKPQIKSNRLLHNDFTTRNGKSRIADTSLNTSSIESPMIRKGSRISQIRGNSIIKIRASGQHNTSKMHHRITPIKVFMLDEFGPINTNDWPVCKRPLNE
jgi:hypothetical protein